MNFLNCSSRQQIVSRTPHAAAYDNANNVRNIGSTALLMMMFCLVFQPFDSVNAKSIDARPGIPPVSKTPNVPAELNEPQGALSLSQAVSLALSHNPALAAVAREIHARDGAVRQAGLLPNPVFDGSAQNFANSSLKGVDGDALNWSLSQTVLLGGKRAKAIRVAELDRELAVWDYESKRMDVSTEVALRYIDVSKAQQALTLANGLVTLADRMMAAVSARVQAGEASPVDETRARVLLASIQIKQQRAERALATARKRLVATWGSTSPEFEVVLGQLKTVKPIPSVATLLDRLTQNPDLARWVSEIVQRQATIRLAKSRAIPDLTVSLGVQQYLKTGDNAVGAGVSIPLPFFDRNQGNVIQANQRFNKAVDMRRSVEVLLTSTLNTVYQQLSADYAEVTILETTVLPGAESAFKAIEEGYRRGRYNLLDVLDAQRTLFDAKLQHLGALASYYQSKANIERLIGEPLETAQSSEVEK